MKSEFELVKNISRSLENERFLLHRSSKKVISRGKQQNRLQIIGGKWRGRVITFPELPTLRPTPNRVRETLFNWLSPVIVNARCLDLFAGSGALGFEALSRGAESTVFMDSAPSVITHLKQTCRLLGAEEVNIINAFIPSYTVTTEKPFTLVFLDPPFGKDLIGPCCKWLEEQHLLDEKAYIYIEAEKTLNPLPVPTHWPLIRSKIAGQVGYHLFCKSSS